MLHRTSVGLAALCGGLPLLGPRYQDPKPPASQPPATPPAATRPADPADVATPEALLAAAYAVISGPAGQKRDWDRMRGLFHPEARLVPMVKGKHGMRPLPLTVEEYIARSGPMLERDGFHEQELVHEIERFGDIAHAFSTYEARRRLGDATPLLRGINSFQLVRQQERWWVLQILWQQEHDAGPIPAAYLPAK
jgi:hypothetical protein